MVKKTRKRNVRRRGVRGKIDANERQIVGRSVIRVRGPGLLLPDQVVEELVWYTTAKMNNATLSYANLRYYLNNPYDCDPTVGTTAIAGLTELAAFYTDMRVTKATMHVEVSNLELFPVCIYTAPAMSFGTDPGANTLANADLPMNPWAKSRLLSAIGGIDHSVVQSQFELADLYSKQVLTDDGFAAATNGSLAAGYRAYFVVGCVTPSTAMVSGLTVFIRMTLRTVFYNRKNLTT